MHTCLALELHHVFFYLINIVANVKRVLMQLTLCIALTYQMLHLQHAWVHHLHVTVVHENDPLVQFVCGLSTIWLMSFLSFHTHQ